MTSLERIETHSIPSLTGLRLVPLYLPGTYVPGFLVSPLRGWSNNLFHYVLFQVGQFAEQLEARVDFAAGKILQALRPEAFHGKRSHHPAVK